MHAPVALWTGSPGRRCDAPQCEALALLINAADEQRHALRRQPSRRHDQLSFDDRLADVLDRGDGFALPFIAEVHHRATAANNVEAMPTNCRCYLCYRINIHHALHHLQLCRRAPSTGYDALQPTSNAM